MDRRDALKKLGMGGATVVGASLVVSSPALANPGTPTCAASSGNPSVTVSQTGNGSSASITVTYSSLGNIDCPCQDAGPTLSSGPSNWSLSGTTSPSATTTNSATWNSVGQGQRTYSFTLRVRCLDQGNRPVCAIWSGSGTATPGGNPGGLTSTQPTGTLSYDDTECA